MTHSHVAAIEAREHRIAHLERRLQEREDTVSLMADELALVAIKMVNLRRDVAAILRSIEAGEAGIEQDGDGPRMYLYPDDAMNFGWARVLCGMALGKPLDES